MVVPVVVVGVFVEGIVVTVEGDVVGAAVEGDVVGDAVEVTLVALVLDAVAGTDVLGLSLSLLESSSWIA